MTFDGKVYCFLILKFTLITFSQQQIEEKIEMMKYQMIAIFDVICICLYTRKN